MADPTNIKLDASTMEKVDEQLVRDDWLQDKWDDKKIIETTKELESYLLHKYVAPEYVDNSTTTASIIKEEKKNTVSLAQKREDLQKEGLCS